jgi:hypothetical protein
MNLAMCHVRYMCGNMDSMCGNMDSMHVSCVFAVIWTGKDTYEFGDVSRAALKKLTGTGPTNPVVKSK